MPSIFSNIQTIFWGAVLCSNIQNKLEHPANENSKQLSPDTISKLWNGSLQDLKRVQCHAIVIIHSKCFDREEIPWAFSHSNDKYYFVRKKALF